MDITAWLKDLGLERYAEAFLDNDVDARVLRTLSADDLKELGVTSLGHRKTLLEAIAALREAGSQRAGGAEGDRPAIPREAERRQLTVMFVDLVGSTELSARLDPEDMGQVIRAYHGACAEVVERWGGHVAKYMGDGVLAYFGWPQAREDEAERAVKAGLELADGIAKLDITSGETLAARIGIATGLVVVGELIGAGVAQEQTVVGETPNLAARLQALAAPGSVVISQATRRLVGGLFELTDLGRQRLKGFAAPLAAFRVEGEGRAEGRFEALHGERLTPLVGREHDLGILLERWAWARDGDGQVVLLSGEPGIGKSRMIRALRERLGDEPYTPLSHYCSPYHTSSALHPVIGLLERAAKLDRDEPPEAQLAKLEAVLAGATENLAEVAPLVAALLGIPTGIRYPAANLTPEVQKRRTLLALVDQLVGLAARQPVLALYEDVHWIDPSTLELLGLVVERIRELPVLVLITFRPEFQPPWTGRAHVTTLTMSRLGRRQGADLVTRVTGDKPLPAEVVDQILGQTDGVPLFIEELTKTVLESGLLRIVGDHYELSGPLPPLAIPTTLYDSRMARLDRLAPVKEVAQTGAVIGREFSHELLAAVAPISGNQLDDALEQLVQSELVFRRGTPPDAVYSFKHALVQDAAYQSLLKSKRQQLHARIAEVLERLTDVGETGPEVLARHLTDAGLSERAIPYWQRAGLLAAERSANAEAATHYSRALGLLRTGPESLKRHERELDLLTSWGSVLINIKGHSSPEVAKAYGRAKELCDILGTTPHLGPVLQGLRNYHMLRCEQRPAEAVARELLALGERIGDDAYLVEGHRAFGVVRFYAGDFLKAADHLKRGVEAYDRERHGSHALRYGYDPGQTCLAYGAATAWVLGYPERAVELADRAIDVAQATSHFPSIVDAIGWRGLVALFCRDVEFARDQAEAAHVLAVEHRLPFWAATATVMSGWVLSEFGQNADGTARIREGLAKLETTGNKLFRPYYLSILAQALARGREMVDGLASLAEAIEGYSGSGVAYWDSELRRLKGELLLARDASDTAAAEGCFGQAIEIAQSQLAKSLELRAATSFARLWHDQGKRPQARDLLAPIYGWFTEGFETADLKEAKALLDELV